MAKEMQRTCKRDGTVWYVPLKLSRKPGLSERLIASGARTRGLGENLTLIGKPSSAGGAYATALGNDHARRNEAQRCPSCGSTSFKEKKVRI